MEPSEAPAVFELVSRAFDEAVRPSFSEQGVAQFKLAARRFLLESPAGHVVHVAVVDGEIVGMIDLRDVSHISLFFVDAAHRSKGVGRALLGAAIAGLRACDDAPVALTVNSAPSAVGAYEHFGFEVSGSGHEKDGIRYVAMRKVLSAGSRSLG